MRPLVWRISWWPSHTPAGFGDLDDCPGGRRVRCPLPGLCSESVCRRWAQRPISWSRKI